MKKKLLLAGLILLTILLGFLRDYIFVSINYFIEAGTDVAGRLVIWKWVLTFVFSVLYFLSTCTFIYLLFQPASHRYYVRMAVFSYGFIFLIASLSGVFGYLFSSFASVYPFIRTVLGVAQSPIVTMILMPVCIIHSRANS